MAVEICFENGRNSNLQGLVTLTLTLDPAIRHTVVHHSSTSTYVPNFIQIEETFCGRTDGRTDGHFPLSNIIRSTFGSRPNKICKNAHAFSTWTLPWMALPFCRTHFPSVQTDHRNRAPDVTNCRKWITVIKLQTGRNDRRETEKNKHTHIYCISRGEIDNKKVQIENQQKYIEVCILKSFIIGLRQ